METNALSSDFNLETLLAEADDQIVEEITEALTSLEDEARTLVARVINNGSGKEIVKPSDEIIGDILFSQQDFVEIIGGTFATDRIIKARESVGSTLPNVAPHIDTIHACIRREVRVWQNALQKRYMSV